MDRTVSVLIVGCLAAAGCDGGSGGADARPIVDAREPDLSCVDQEYPAEVPDPIAYGGEVFEPGLTGSSEDAVVGDAVIRARALAGATVIAVATSGDDGRYELAVPTGGEPLFTYFDVSHPAYLDTNIFLPTAIFEPRDDAVIALFTQAHVDALEGFAGVDTGADEGLLVVRAFDCSGVPLEGAMLTTEPPPLTQLYMNQIGLPDYNLTRTSSNGAVALFGLAAGATELRGEFRGRPMRANAIFVARLTGGTISTAGIVP